jgi:hypothetical protein
MAYRVRIDPVALDQIEQFAAWLSDYSEEFAIDWIVYTGDEDARIVDTLLFWSASRDPERLDLR